MVEKYFSFDAGTVVALGRDSIKDVTTAITELVKNSYDADADTAIVEIITKDPSQSLIRISDNGSGMTEGRFDESWLRIGYSAKRTEKRTEKKRRSTGEKGIGRLSANRLGKKMTIYSSSSSEAEIHATIDWRDFETSKKDASKVAITLEKNEENVISYPENSKTGTQITITHLRDTWKKENIQDLHKELSLLCSPDETTSSPFKIILDSDLHPEISGEIKNSIEHKPLIYLELYYDGKENIIYRTDIIRKTKSGASRQTKGSSEKITLAQAINQKGQEKRISEIGEVRLSLKFYPQTSSYIDGVSFSKSDLKAYINDNAGIRIYRDSIRVKPYGEPGVPEGDWLGLADRRASDPAGKSRTSFKVTNKQVVGAVHISRDNNPTLLDSSSREGLLESDSLALLRSITMAGIRLLETAYVDESKAEKEKGHGQGSISQPVNEPKEQLEQLKKSISEISKEIPQELHQNIEEIEKSSTSIVKAYEDLADRNQTLRSLATIGISTAAFGHETENSLSQLSGSILLSEEILDDENPDITIVKREIAKAKRASTNISAWGRFALTRVKRDKRTRKNEPIDQLIINLISQLESAFESTSTEIITELSPVTGKVFSVDIESMLINLLTNSYFAVMRTQRKRKIKVTLLGKKINDRHSLMITISDSGPGIPKKLHDTIFEPLYSSRTDTKGRQTGTGLGLTIVKSIIDDSKGKITVDKDPELKGARFTITLPV